MPTEHLETDYLILGAGAMAMGFADVILDEDPSARIVMVDRHANPGGHWNDAYPFVRLHQPAAFYGLNTMELGTGGEDLSSGADLLAYFRNAMDKFLHTGRVRFLPMSEYEGDGRIVSTVEPDKVTTVDARRRIVNGTYNQVKVPSVTPPRYEIDKDATVVAPNDLVQIRRPWERYVIVGAGKTGIDSIIFLLANGVAPDRIRWIMPNDAWLLDRAQMQPDIVLDAVVAMVQSLADSPTIDETFLRLEREDIVFRLDGQSLPTKWRCATVDRKEFAQLQRVRDIVRMGRVQRVGRDEVVLDEGTIDSSPDTLFVDCSANGLVRIDPHPIFTDHGVTLQPAFMCQQTFSAALIAHLELLDLTDERRNHILRPVPHPEAKEDIAAALVVTSENMLRCQRNAGRWLRRSRLYLGHHAPMHRFVLGSAQLARITGKASASMDRMGAAPQTGVYAAG